MFDTSCEAPNGVGTGLKEEAVLGLGDILKKVSSQLNPGETRPKAVSRAPQQERDLRFAATGGDAKPQREKY